MTDFDFEAGLRQECETNSGWPFLPGFLDPRLSEHRDRPNSMNEELRHSNDSVGDGFNQAGNMPFSTAAQFDATQPNRLPSEYSTTVGDDLLHSLFGTQN